MFKSRNPFVRFVLNSVLAFVLFWVFRSVGWIHVSDATPLWAVAFIVTVASVFVGWLMTFILILLSPMIVVVSCITLGLGFLLIGPVTQYFGLLLISKVSLLYTISTVWWQALIMGASFGWFSFSSPSKTRRSNQSSSLN